ncbi:hypothetical protein FGO68_gene513 [Halteria grandinella]|uniref:Uncharacterized protein n=1 Tax=Halteria grandinella TaxID=5974 RepID=A0A8J8T9T2_HALGN|nr:hypothetical protein FGO68_gene513 [Halteria grandinella]
MQLWIVADCKRQQIYINKLKYIAYLPNANYKAEPQSEQQEYLHWFQPKNNFGLLPSSHWNDGQYSSCKRDRANANKQTKESQPRQRAQI